MTKYTEGMALILEGATEKVFWDNNTACSFGKMVCQQVRKKI